MSVPKFTPGPWFTDPDADLMMAEPGVYREPLDPLFDPQNVTVAIVIMLHCNVTNEEATANAALISAAPEMYALLEDIAEQNISGLSMYARINSLLAKARGEVRE